MARLLQDDQGQRLGSTGAGQLPACTAKGLCGRAACRRLARRLSPRLRGQPSWVLADWAFSPPGSVSMTKSLSQKPLLSQAAPREVKCPYGGPRSLSGCRCGAHVRGAGVSETSGSAVAWVGRGHRRRGLCPAALQLPRLPHASPARMCRFSRSEPGSEATSPVDVVCASPDPARRPWCPVSGLRHARCHRKLADLAPLPGGQGPCPWPSLRRCMPGAEDCLGTRRPPALICRVNE